MGSAMGAARCRPAIVPIPGIAAGLAIGFAVDAFREETMLFAISCIDKPGSGDIRAANRDAHLAYLRQHADQIMAAGPYLSDSGDAMTGSLLLMEFPDRSSAEAFATNDPYAKAELFDRVTIRPWRKVLPKE
jgi:uncharacterized protein YciI